MCLRSAARENCNLSTSINYSVTFHSYHHPINCSTTIFGYWLLSNNSRNFTWDLTTLRFTEGLNGLIGDPREGSIPKFTPSNSYFPLIHFILTSFLINDLLVNHPPVLGTDIILLLIIGLYLAKMFHYF